MTKWFPLYVYSGYSFHQSTVHIERLVGKLKENQISTCALTDNSVLYGTYKFYNLLLKNNIKPIIGLKIKCLINESIDNLLLYAKNQEGYLNILKISSIINTSKEKIISFDNLLKFKKGLIVISLESESLCFNAIKNNDIDKIKSYCLFYLKQFENYYFGLSNQTNEEINIFTRAYQILSRLGIKSVLTNSVKMIEESDTDALSVLQSKDTNNKYLSEKDVNSYFNYSINQEKNLLGFTEIYNNLNEINNLIENNIVINDHQKHFPILDSGINEEEYLYNLASKGLEKRLKQNNIYNTKVYFDRLDFEYNIIKQMGYCGYFLIVYDYVKYAKQKDILVGPGRGSGAASVICWSLGIIDIDPLKYNLLFERFLNPERVSMPDIDVDFPNESLKDVRDYVVNKYGKKKVARIAVITKYQYAGAIDEVSKFYQIDSKIASNIKKILDKYSKEDLTISEIVSKDDSLKQSLNEYPETVGRLLKTSNIIQGLPNDLSTHVSGIIVSDDIINQFTPLEAKEEDIYQTQYQADDLEDLGLLKMDFLPSVFLTNIKKTIDLIKKDKKDFTLPTDESNPNVYKLISNGLVKGVFQLESSGFSKVIQEMQVANFEELVAAIALYRPGPKDQIKNYIDCKFKRKQPNYLHEDLKEILKETYGVIVYQEQIMMIALKFAGYNLGKADVLRRAVAKKKREVLEKERINFVSSSIKQGYPEVTANAIYDYFVNFADFGFNKAHSVAYAKITYLTAWLKCFYPEYYYSVLFENAISSKNEIESLLKELKILGIKVYAPRINKSTTSFEVFPQSILFPLTMVDKVDERTSQLIIEERNKGAFTSYQDFIVRTKTILREEQLNNLIFAGAFSEFKITKKGLVEGAKYHLNTSQYVNVPGLLKFEYPTVDYPYGELMIKEKLALGFNFNYRFTALYQNAYKNNNLKEITNASMFINNRFQTLGIIKNLRELSTKNGEKMASFILDDMNGEIDVVVFPKQYENIHNLKEGKVIAVFGKVDNNKGKLQIVTDFIKEI